MTTTRRTLAFLLLAVALLAQGAPAQTPAGPVHYVIPPDTENPGLDGVAMDGAGNMTFLFTIPIFEGTFREEAYIRRFSATDTPLGPAVRLGPATVSTNGGSIAANQRGDVVFTWSRASGGSTSYFLRRTSPVLGTLTLPIKGLADVAVDNNGNFVVIWGSGGEVLGQRYNADGTKRGPEFNAATSRAGTKISPSVAMNPSTGEFVVVWEVREAGSEGTLPASVRGQRFGFFTGRQGSELVVYTRPVSEPSSIISFYAPDVARANNGGFVVVWRTDFGRDVLGQRYNNEGVPLGGRLVIAASAGIPDGRPHIAMAPNGRFVVSWDDQGTSPQWFRLFRPNGTPWGPVLVEPPFDGAPYNGSGRVAFGRNDSFVIGWTNYNDEGDLGNTISFHRFLVP
ncbi:MAG TPA: hypothetical protein VF789_28340 [Thermoanaerobaculia bacterium]